ncbi:MAG TPA: hypothetical protein VF275_10345 [Gammaproteobacteria bacterium]
MTSCNRKLLVLVLALFAPACDASITPLDTLALRAGGFLTQFDLAVHRAEDEDDRIDFDQELGLEEHTLIESVSFAWRPWLRHEFGIGYFNQLLTGTRRLRRDLEFEDEVFPVATTVYSSFALESFEFHYTYWLFTNEDWALGPRFAFVDYRMRNRIEMLLGEAGEPPAVRVSALWQEHVPTPTFGVDFRYTPASNWRISANAGWFEAEFDKVSPVVASARAGVEYFFGDRLGIWLDYGLTHLDVGVRGSRIDGEVEIYEGGLRLGLVWRM